MDGVIKAIDDCNRKLGKIVVMTAGKAPENITLKDLMKMSAKGNSINKTITKAMKTYDANPVPPTEEQAAAILVKMEELVGKQETQMKWSRDSKPSFDKLHISGFVKKNLVKNEGTADSLAKLMLEKTPPSMNAQAAELEKRAKTAFDKTMALYSNATGGEDTQIADEDSD